MLNCKSESLANGEKQSERSRCLEMVADCSKSPDRRPRARVVPVTSQVAQSLHWLWASCSHTGTYVTKHYNLPLTKGRWCSVTGT